MDSKSNSRDPLAVPRTNRVFKKEDAFLAKKSSCPWAGFGYQGHGFSPMTLQNVFYAVGISLVTTRGDDRGESGAGDNGVEERTLDPASQAFSEIRRHVQELSNLQGS